MLDGEFYDLIFEDIYVFEDIWLCLVDVDLDGVLEIVMIRVYMNNGVGIVIYKVIND